VSEPLQIRGQAADPMLPRLWTKIDELYRRVVASRPQNYHGLLSEIVDLQNELLGDQERELVCLREANVQLRAQLRDAHSRLFNLGQAPKPFKST
jgi:hypothetical protein